MMCVKNTPYVQKFFGGCMVLMVIVVIIMDVFISNSGGSESKVELSGDQDEALI